MPARWWTRPTSCAGGRRACSTSEPVRIGYVNWCPTDWAERAAGVAQLRVDTWVMPSHAQAARVSDGSLDLAICWVQTTDLASLSLDAHLIGVDRLYALSVGTDTSPVEAKDTLVLLDADEASWSSWNRYAEQFAADTGASIMRVDDGGVTGPDVFRARTPAAPASAEQPEGPERARSPAVWCGVRWSTRHRCGRGRWSGAAVKTALRCVPSSTNSPVTLQNWASTTRGRGCLARIRTGRGESEPEQTGDQRRQQDDQRRREQSV